MFGENVLYFNDIHAGDPTALCPPGIIGFDGKEIGVSEFQYDLWNFYGECLEKATDWFKGNKFDLVLGSELVQGNWVRFAGADTMPNQFRILKGILYRLLDTFAEGSLTKTYILQGNEVHTGLDNAVQEIMGQSLIDDFNIKTNSHRLSWLDLWERFPNDAVFHGTHLFNVSNIYTTSAYEREWTYMRKGRALHGLPEPDVCYRAHVHRLNAYWMPQGNPLTEVGCFSGPGWQAKNVHVQKSLARYYPTEYGLCANVIEEGKIRLKSHAARVPTSSEDFA